MTKRFEKQQELKDKAESLATEVSILSYLLTPSSNGSDSLFITESLHKTNTVFDLWVIPCFHDLKLFQLTY